MNIKNLLSSVFTFCFFEAFTSWTRRPQEPSSVSVIRDWFCTRPRRSKLRGDGVYPPRSVFASHLLVSFRFTRESIRRGCLWFAVTLSCSTWPLITPPHPAEDSQEPLANPADEMKIFHLSLLKPLSNNNSGESDPPAEKSINEKTEHIYFWVKVLFVDLYLQPCSILIFYIFQVRYIALMWRHCLESQFIPCDCPSWWAQNPSSDNGIHLRLYIACICYLSPSSNKSNLVSLMWTTDHCKLVKESG